MIEGHAKQTMVTLTIDGRQASAEVGTTILSAAKRLGIRIPTLCHVEGLEPASSCFVCAVQIEGRRTFSPACAMPVSDGMVVITNSDDVRTARRMSLELLLSDHAGECVAPCAARCPAGLDIPGFVYGIATGDNRGSMEVIADRLALPGSLGRVCPRLCEQECRRCELDQGLAIGALHRYVADLDAGISSAGEAAHAPASSDRAAIPQSGTRRADDGYPSSVCGVRDGAVPGTAEGERAAGEAAHAPATHAPPVRASATYVPLKAPSTGKPVAIVGAGPAGLAAAYYLLQKGHDCTLFDAHPLPGGMLRYGIPSYRLPKDALDAEIGAVRKLGARFQMGERWGREFTLPSLREKHQAVFLAIGAQRAQGLRCEGEELALGGVEFLELAANAASRGSAAVWSAGILPAPGSHHHGEAPLAEGQCRPETHGEAAGFYGAPASTLTGYPSGLPAGPRAPLSTSTVNEAGLVDCSLSKTSWEGPPARRPALHKWPLVRTANLPAPIPALHKWPLLRTANLPAPIPALSGEVSDSIGDDVVVVGGGNTAMDCARSAVRRGARRVRVLYRRSRREMPCLMEEVEAAEAEGVQVELLVAPVRLRREAANRLSLTCQRMELGEPDASGRRQPVPIKDSEFVVECSSVIAAIGQSVERPLAEREGLLVTAWGIAVDEQTLATNLPGVFAGGDAVLGADLAVRAVAAGRRAAASIHQYISGEAVTGEPVVAGIAMRPMDDAERAAIFRAIENAARVPMPHIPMERRLASFDEVELGLPDADAGREARRCLTCGCRKADCCLIRSLATEYDVDVYRFTGARRRFSQDLSHPQIIYEPGKCICCDACVRIAAQAGEEFGLTMIGRGFDVAVGVPFDKPLAEGLRKVARQCAAACPTGALALRTARSCDACALISLQRR